MQPLNNINNRMDMQKILLIGSGAREHAIAKALKNSKKEIELYAFVSNLNPGIIDLAINYKLGSVVNVQSILEYAQENQIDFAFIGPEAPLGAGVADALEKINIPSVGPLQELAQLETSKSFTRNLLAQYNIDASPRFKTFNSMECVEDFINELDGNFVIKPDGLTGGKGVQVIGDHFNTAEEGLKIIQNLIDNNETLVIEEKLIGQEFSLMSYCDGENLLHMPAVQDHKRVGVDDTGANTGGMGSYSIANFSLPFLEQKDIEQAYIVNTQVAQALKNKFNKGYKGILYGNFIKTKNGCKIIEYNARLGDPEAMNVLSLFPPKQELQEGECDFLQICEAIINGSLYKLKPSFKKVASVCKYVVPQGYPENPIKEGIIDISEVDETKVNIFYAAVDAKKDGIHLIGSRAIALVATHEDVYGAEKIVEAEIKKIKGSVIHRPDIGTRELIAKKVQMVREL